MQINKVILYGNITKEIELKNLPNNTKVVNFSIATNNVWKDKNTGNKREEAEYHNITAYGKTAELIHQYLGKGSGIYIEGRLKTSTWEKDGAKYYKTEVIAESMQFGPKRGGAVAQSAQSDAEVVPDIDLGMNADEEYDKMTE